MCAPSQVPPWEAKYGEDRIAHVFVCGSGGDENLRAHPRAELTQQVEACAELWTRAICAETSLNFD
jgi:hypothetical protein